MGEVFDRVVALRPRRSDWPVGGGDLLAGLTVAVVALPLALAFGVASGLGAQAGLATAVVAGLVAAIFGGSNLQVSGPTGAMTVVLLPVVARFGPDGVLMVGDMAGVLLVVFALTGLGRLVSYLPMPVVEGFTVGIAVVIALQQVPAALGVPASGSEHVSRVAIDAVEAFARDPSLGSVAIGLSVAVVMLVGARVRPGVPFSLFAVAAATLLTSVLSVATPTLGAIPSGLPAPSVGFVDFGRLEAMLPAALALAALGALESLLSATVADGMSVSHRTDPDRELFGQGLANIAAPVFGGVPATGAIARTAVNVRAGASSRLSAVVHALVLAAIAFSSASLVAEIPLAALAGVLFATAVQMAQSASIGALVRASRGDAAVMALTFAVTVFVDLVSAVAVGVGVAVMLALRSVASAARLEHVPIEHGDHSVEERKLLAERIVAYRLDGPLVFAAAHRFLLELTEVAAVDVVILRMARVSTIDATGAGVLGDAITHLERRGIIVLLSGVAAQHADVLSVLGEKARLREQGRVFATTLEAIAHAPAMLIARETS